MLKLDFPIFKHLIINIVKKLLLVLSLFLLIYACGKEETASDQTTLTFLEKYDNTVWISNLKEGDNDYIRNRAEIVKINKNNMILIDSEKTEGRELYCSLDWNRLACPPGWGCTIYDPVYEESFCSE